LRFLVTGSAGRLGRKLIPELFWAGHEVIGVDILSSPVTHDPKWQTVTLDLMDNDALESLVRVNRPDVVIHAAAMTNVDKCETERELAYQINADLPARIAKICRKHENRMVLISTDYVFDGSAGPYLESAQPCPISYYGKTKLAGENEVLGESKHNAVARTCVLFGYEPESAPDFVTWLLTKLRNNQPVNIVTDQYSTPTLTDNLSNGVRLIAEQSAQGIFHLTGADYLNRYEMALQIAEFAKLPVELISPVDGSKFTQIAPRPKLGGLLCNRAIDELGYIPLTFQKAMQEYYQQEAVKN